MSTNRVSNLTFVRTSCSAGPVVAPSVVLKGEVSVELKKESAAVSVNRGFFIAGQEDEGYRYHQCGVYEYQYAVSFSSEIDTPFSSINSVLFFLKTEPIECNIKEENCRGFIKELLSNFNINPTPQWTQQLFLSPLAKADDFNDPKKYLWCGWMDCYNGEFEIIFSVEVFAKQTVDKWCDGENFSWNDCTELKAVPSAQLILGKAGNEFVFYLGTQGKL